MVEKGIIVIGYFIWWAVRDVLILREELKALLKTFKIPHPFAEVDDPEKVVAFHRSAFLKAKREVQQEFGQKFLIRKIAKNADAYTFGLVDESISQADKRLNYRHSATMTFLPATGDLLCDFPHRAFEEIQKKYEQYKDYCNSDDVRQILLETIDQYHRVSVRSRGGIYFIPAKFSQQVANIEQFVSALPGECSLAVAPQVDFEESKKAIYKAFVDDLKNKIANYKQELEDNAFSRQSAWAARLDAFKDLRNEIEFYADAMAFRAENLKEEIAELEGRVRAKLAS